MKTRLTEMVGIKYPIVLSGVSWTSTPEMVAAVSNAGGLANVSKTTKEATEYGDTKTGALPVGQVQGLIHDGPTVAELFERTIAEAQKAQSKVNAAFISKEV
jgi:NAD(P)H-dependent flavin oxidoreductase YrpB (nitropropane dioxygenase family)